MALAIQQSGLEVVLVEPGLAGVRNAVQRGIRHVVRSTLEDAGMVPNSIPAVGLFDVIEHIADDMQFLKRTSRLMCPGGRIYITVPAYRGLWSDEDVLAGHFRRYALRDLSDVLTKSGFALEYATYFFSFLPLPILFCRVLPSRLGRGTKQYSASAVRSNHEAGRPMTRRLLETMTSWELSRIAQQRPLPFGGSCLAVARRQ